MKAILDNPDLLLCPRCDSELIRVRRRVFDRLVSLMRPRFRYRCSGLNCGWEGNISVSKLKAHASRLPE